MLQKNAAGKNNMRDGFDLKRFICIYGKKIVPAVILWIFAGAAVFFLTDICRMLLFHSDTTFRSDVMYHIIFDTEEAEETKLYYNDYTWNDVLDSDMIAGVAAQKLSLSKEEVAASTHIPTMSDIRLIHVYADADNPEGAEKIQRAIGEALAAFGTDTDGFVSIEKWDEKAVEQVKADPYYSRWCICGAAVGFIFGVLFILWKYSCDDGIYLEDDTERLAGIMTAGVVFSDKTVSSGMKDNIESVVKDKKTALFITPSNKDSKADELIGEIVADIEKTDINNSDAVIIAIPYGMSSAAVRREIKDLKLQGKEVAAAIIYSADKITYKTYYLTI